MQQAINQYNRGLLGYSHSPAREQLDKFQVKQKWTGNVQLHLWGGEGWPLVCQYADSQKGVQLVQTEIAKIW